MKLDLLDTYKSKPPTSDVKKNDVALLVSLAYKFSEVPTSNLQLPTVLAEWCQ